VKGLLYAIPLLEVFIWQYSPFIFYIYYIKNFLKNQIREDKYDLTVPVFSYGYVAPKLFSFLKKERSWAEIIGFRLSLTYRIPLTQTLELNLFRAGSTGTQLLSFFYI